MQSRLGWVAVWMSLCSGSFGCAARVAESEELTRELARSRQQAMLSELRLAALERRMSELQSVAAQQPDQSAETQAQLLYRLDLLVAQNQRLLEQASPAPQPDPFERTVAASAAPPLCQEPLAPEEQLRRSVERMRDDTTRWRGGLTPAQIEAVHLLLRRRRSLDPSNPWSS